MVNSKLKKYISPMYVNGLNGRLLRIPAPPSKKRSIFLLYGHHASLERMFGLAEVLNSHGAVTMPDLPGFGGMDSFYKIGKQPDIENYADYLDSLLKLHYKRQKVTIVALSFAVPLVIRTLQKYPELSRKVELFVSIAGFAHHQDFIFDKKVFWLLKSLAYNFSYKIPAVFAKKVLLTSPAIRSSYMFVGDSHSKLKDASTKAELEKRINFEIGLWKINDVRTRAKTMTMMFNIDLCSGPKVDVPLCHVTTSEDRYFDHQVVEQHLKVIFKDTQVVSSEMPTHAPTIIATAKEAEPYIPKSLRRRLG